MKYFDDFPPEVRERLRYANTEVPDLFVRMQGNGLRCREDKIAAMLYYIDQVEVIERAEHDCFLNNGWRSNDGTPAVCVTTEGKKGPRD